MARDYRLNSFNKICFETIGIGTMLIGFLCNNKFSVNGSCSHFCVFFFLIFLILYVRVKAMRCGELGCMWDPNWCPRLPQPGISGPLHGIRRRDSLTFMISVHLFGRQIRNIQQHNFKKTKATYYQKKIKKRKYIFFKVIYSLR